MDSKEISIEQINKLDATAFRMLYKTYYKALVCYAIQITGESGAAEDIVQELFSTIWESKCHLSHWCHLRLIYIIPFGMLQLIISSIRMLNLIICKDNRITSGIQYRR